MKNELKISSNEQENADIARDAQAIVDGEMATFRQGPREFAGGFRIPRPPEEIVAAAQAIVDADVAALAGMTSHTQACLSAGGGPSDDDCICGAPIAAAPQVVADERAAFEAMILARVQASHPADVLTDEEKKYLLRAAPKGEGDYAAYENEWIGWQARATLAAAPVDSVALNLDAQLRAVVKRRDALAAALVQAQEPVAYRWPDGPGEFYYQDVADPVSNHARMTAELLYLAPVQPVAVPDGSKPIAPAHCPITGRKFWGNIDHPERGLVATYGGPFDTYSIPYLSDDNELRVERFDQDAGDWVEGGEPCGWYSDEQPAIAPAAQGDAVKLECCGSTEFCERVTCPAQGDAKDAERLASVSALAHKWNADAIKDGFAGSDAAFELLEMLGWPDAAIAAKAVS